MTLDYLFGIFTGMGIGGFLTAALFFHWLMKEE